ncbi:MAG: FmdE family protein [Desulfobacteraceae bacterium]
MKSFETLLKESAAAHGHLSMGQVLGVRMAMEGCRRIGIENPGEMPDIEKLIVFVEINRCPADAIAYVTGTSLGRRSLIFMDYGIIAASFVNIETGKAFRLEVKKSARASAAEKTPPGADPEEAEQIEIEVYRQMDTDDLFSIDPVQVDVKACDMPGPPQFKAVCQKCGQIILDRREVIKNDQTLCRACAMGAYYKAVNTH